jgi:hypothetical protein
MKAIDRERPIRRRIIRQWTALPRDRRQTAEQAQAFAKSKASEPGFARSRRDPDSKITGWLMSRL